jgi:hypothetical protein
MGKYRFPCLLANLEILEGNNIMKGYIGASRLMEDSNVAAEGASPDSLAPGRPEQTNDELI